MSCNYGYLNGNAFAVQIHINYGADISQIFGALTNYIEDHCPGTIINESFDCITDIYTDIGAGPELVALMELIMSWSMFQINMGYLNSPAQTLSEYTEIDSLLASVIANQDQASIDALTAYNGTITLVDSIYAGTWDVNTLYTVYPDAFWSLSSLLQQYIQIQIAFLEEI